jgi:hypothetical protein
MIVFGIYEWNSEGGKKVSHRGWEGIEVSSQKNHKLMPKNEPLNHVNITYVSPKDNPLIPTTHKEIMSSMLL